MKITEGARSIRATVVKAFSLSSSLFVSLSLSLSLTHSPPGISVGSGRCQFRSALSESRSIGSWAVWIRSRERNKPRPDSAKTGLLPAATVKKRERGRGRKDRLYARLKHEEDASREYYALRVPGNKSKMNAWCAVTKSGGGGKNSIPVPYQPLQVVNYGEDSFPSLFFLPFIRPFDSRSVRYLENQVNFLVA